MKGTKLVMRTVRYICFLCLSAFCIMFLLTACQGAAEERQSDPLLKLSRMSGWQADKGNPIIQAGDFMDKGLWNDPHVFKEGGQYVMYLTSSGAKAPFKPPILPFRAVSNNGLDWKLSPKRPLLDVSGTPFVSIETPSVVKYKNEYHLFYTGVYKEGAAPPFAIGHATSKDGIHWKKDALPVLTATGNASEDWNGYLVGEPGAVVYNNKIYLYFTAIQALPGKTPSLSQTIGVATTVDGKTFEKPRIALQLSVPYLEGDKFCGYSTPMATINNDKIHLFYDVVTYDDAAEPNWQQVGLHHAVSTDGNRFAQDKAPMFTRNDFNWTTGEILAPSALFEDKKLRLWFAGHVRIQDFGPLIRSGIKGRDFGIGHASISLDE